MSEERSQKRLQIDGNVVVAGVFYDFSCDGDRCSGWEQPDEDRRHRRIDSAVVEQRAQIFLSFFQFAPGLQQSLDQEDGIDGGYQREGAEGEGGGLQQGEGSIPAESVEQKAYQNGRSHGNGQIKALLHQKDEEGKQDDEFDQDEVHGFRLGSVWFGSQKNRPGLRGGIKT